MGSPPAIYTRDISRALRLARRIEAGSVWINGWWMGGVQAPTGGIKDSGIGRERGLAGHPQLSADQERGDPVVKARVANPAKHCRSGTEPITFRRAYNR